MLHSVESGYRGLLLMFKLMGVTPLLLLCSCPLVSLAFADGVEVQ